MHDTNRDELGNFGRVGKLAVELTTRVLRPPLGERGVLRPGDAGDQAQHHFGFHGNRTDEHQYPVRRRTRRQRHEQSVVTRGGFAKLAGRRRAGARSASCRTNACAQSARDRLWLHTWQPRIEHKASRTGRVDRSVRRRRTRPRPPERAPATARLVGRLGDELDEAKRA